MHFCDAVLRDEKLTYSGENLIGSEEIVALNFKVCNLLMILLEFLFKIDRNLQSLLCRMGIAHPNFFQETSNV